MNEIKHTAQEDEAFEAMAVEWDGNGLPPVGCVCEFKKLHEDDDRFSECYIVGTRKGAQIKNELWLVFSDKYDNLHQHHCGQGVYVFRKPETPEQKAERERLEAAYDLYRIVTVAHGDEAKTIEHFTKFDYKDAWLEAIDEGYRKQ